MDNRTEPRFKTEAASSLKVVRHDKICELSCLVVDVSGVGFKLIMQEPLDRGEMIRLQVGHGHTLAHVLAVVRYCRLVEDQFSVGVERVDEWLVAPRIAEERVDESLVAPKAVQPTEALVEGALRVLGRPKVKHLDRLHTLAIRQLFADMIQEKKGRPPKIAAATGAVLAVVLLAMLFSRVPVRLRAGSTASTSAIFNKDKEQYPATQSNATNSSHEPPSDVQPLETQAGVAGAGAPADPQVVSADTPQQMAASSSAVLPEHLSLSQGSKHQILVKSHDLSWVVACADGKKVFEKLVKTGETNQVGFSSQALLHAGNAGALDIAIDSGPFGSMGEPGTVHTWRFSVEGSSDKPAVLPMGSERVPSRFCAVR